MRPKRMVQRTLVAVVLSLGVAGSAWAQKVCPDRHNVTQQGKVITVKPTGKSDTENLQCAIDLAVAAGRGSVVQLRGGPLQPFHTAQLVATNFKGTIRGEGMKATIIQNLPSLCVTPDSTFLLLPLPLRPRATNLFRPKEPVGSSSRLSAVTLPSGPGNKSLARSPPGNSPSPPLARNPQDPRRSPPP